ncbi:hypothetical protein [Bacteroides sp.]
MKMNKLIVIIVLLLGTVSCETSYRMVSRINTDGSLYREVYGNGDSAFVAGNRTRNPFLFQIDSDWQLVKLDSSVKFNFWGEEQELNVKVYRTIPEVDGEYFRVSDTKEYASPLAVPKEKLEKKFRWFYTYYSYRATFAELPDKGPVPLNKYLTDEEQQIWLRGDKNAFSGLNGIELNNRLDDIESKFWKWYNRSQYEISLEVIARFASLQSDTSYVQRLREFKEVVYDKYLSKKQDDTTPEEVCGFFDDFERANHFSDLYKTNKENMDTMFEERSRIVELFGYAVRYELTMPGRIISSNAMLQDSHSSVVWKIDAFRLLADDFTLTAESRVPNYWAFAVTLLVILFAIWCWWKTYRQYK